MRPPNIAVTNRLKRNVLHSIVYLKHMHRVYRDFFSYCVVNSKCIHGIFSSESFAVAAIAICQSRYWSNGREVIYEDYHDDVIKWKHFPRYRPFVRGIHRSPVISPHKGQWRGALMFFFDLFLTKQLSKQSWGWWFETPSCRLWRHCNDRQNGIVPHHNKSKLVNRVHIRWMATMLHSAAGILIPRLSDFIMTSCFPLSNLQLILSYVFLSISIWYIHLLVYQIIWTTDNASNIDPLRRSHWRYNAVSL